MLSSKSANKLRLQKRALYASIFGPIVKLKEYYHIAIDNAK